MIGDVAVAIGAAGAGAVDGVVVDGKGALAVAVTVAAADGDVKGDVSNDAPPTAVLVIGGGNRAPLYHDNSSITIHQTHTSIYCIFMIRKSIYVREWL